MSGLLAPPAAGCDVPVRPFPTDGVRLSHFHQFIADCGGRDALAHLTTTQVCERFVKPATARLEASYCDMLAQRQKEEPPGVVGKATAFISHAWKCVFLDVVDALLAHFNNDDGDDVVVWFDVFSNNQHQEMAIDFLLVLRHVQGGNCGDGADRDGVGAVARPRAVDAGVVLVRAVLHGRHGQHVRGGHELGAAALVLGRHGGRGV